MKKMISSMKTLVALLMVGATVTSCSSDDTIADQPVQQPVGPQVYTMTVEATKGGDGTRALNLDGNKLNATWTAGDKVEVWSVDGTTTKYGELTATAAGSSTTLTGTLTTLPENGATLTLKYLSPNYSSQDGTLTGTENSIDKVCDYATATVTATVDGDNVTTTAAAFENQQAVVKFTLKNKANDSDLSATKLVVNVGGTEYEVNPVSATSEIYVAIPGFTGQTITLTATVGSDTYTLTTSSAKSFANGSFYRVTAKMTKQASAPEGAISGKFTINSSGDKVYFSKGNLQATTTDLGEHWTWHFAENQWDYIGGRHNGGSETTTSNNFINGNGTVSTNGTVDLFGWSTSATTYGMNNSTSASTYSGDFVDWGSNSDLQTALGTGWFTLSSDEWTYLFNTRSASTVNGTADARFAKGWVNSVRGVILFPDTYTHPDSVTAPTGVNATDNTGFYDNDYSSADWTKMEAAGCVFLPAAGDRNGWWVNNAGSAGYYWSSSPDGGMFALSVYFSSSSLTLAYSRGRYGGYSVRLVRDVE